MNKKIYFNWELFHRKVNFQSENSCYRSKVIGGWIVLNQIESPLARMYGESMVFIPDENHTWEVESIIDGEDDKAGE